MNISCDCNKCKTERQAVKDNIVGAVVMTVAYLALVAVVFGGIFLFLTTD